MTLRWDGNAERTLRSLADMVPATLRELATAAARDESELVASEVDVVAGLKIRRCGIVFFMTKVLKEAIAEVATLPESDQELIGRELLAHVEKLRSLRADIEHGARSLDAGKGGVLDIEDVISRARGRYAKG